MFACLLDKAIDFHNTSPLDSKSLGGECYTPYEGGNELVSLVHGKKLSIIGQARTVPYLKASAFKLK